jgi:hypothetical protein
MSFWNNDDAERQAALRREEELERRRAEDRQRRERARLARQQDALRQKEQKLRRAQQAAEDKKLRDELMAKMLNKAKAQSTTNQPSLPRLNRGFGGDRETPSHETFKHLKPPPGSNQPNVGAPQAKSEESRDTQRAEIPSRSFPPLKRPF